MVGSVGSAVLMDYRGWVISASGAVHVTKNTAYENLNMTWMFCITFILK